MSRTVSLLASLLLAGLLLTAIVRIPPDTGDGPPIVERIYDRAPAETGATNLVSAIYLGYRAYDTLGEALVLLLAVTGVFVFAREGKV